MGKSSSAPRSPDPAVTAAAQGKENRDTALFNAQLNRINQFTPLGSLTYTSTPTFDEAGYSKALADYYAQKSAYDARQYGGTTKQPGQYVASGGVKIPANISAAMKPPTMPDRAMYENGSPQWSSTVSLSPQVQKIFDQQIANDLSTSQLAGDQMGMVRSMLGQPLESVNQDDVIGAIMSRLEPQFARDEEALRTRMSNQGLGVGSEAWNTEFDNFGQQKNDARLQALLHANQYAGQNLQNQQLQRSIPLNEMLALKNGAQLAMPQFSAPGQAQAGTTNISDLIMQGYQNDVANANAQAAQDQATVNSLASLAMMGIFLGGSDIRIKKDIKRVGQMDDGTPIYTFRYINGDPMRYMGVMAQDIEKTKPDAVIDVNGIKMVNYGAL